MGKITSKYQISIPKALAEQLDLKPGDEIGWTLAGEELRITSNARQEPLSVEARLAMFDAATARQRARDKGRHTKVKTPASRGWKREDLYERGRRTR